MRSSWSSTESSRNWRDVRSPEDGMVFAGFLSLDQRREMLQSLGAGGDQLAALLEYDRNGFDLERLREVRELPVEDEPHLEVWREYAGAASAGDGAIAVLRRSIVQLSFPVEEGISGTASYGAATKKGQWPFDLRPPAFVEEAGIRLEIEPTAGGSVPIITASAREDFETLVRVFSARNEPVPVPASMGACIVTGFNNWDRIARLRQRWQENNPDASDADWSAEFRQIIPRKELYQDRFIILSSGPYSNVSAAAAGFGEDEWLSLSGSIRRSHEATHYFTYRLLGSMRNNVIDEIMADYAGLVATFGSYDATLALLFLGLESYPECRDGGRIANYLGDPPLEGKSLEVLYDLAYRAVKNLEQFDESLGEDRDELLRARSILAISALTLEELAHRQGPEHLSRMIEEETGQWLPS